MNSDASARPMAAPRARSSPSPATDKSDGGRGDGRGDGKLEAVEMAVQRLPVLRLWYGRVVRRVAEYAVLFLGRHVLGEGATRGADIGVPLGQD